MRVVHSSLLKIIDKYQLLTATCVFIGDVFNDTRNKKKVANSYKNQELNVKFLNRRQLTSR